MFVTRGTVNGCERIGGMCIQIASFVYIFANQQKTPFLLLYVLLT
ncbi:Predicted protein [Anoxybacillus flavithermus WK1]|uniref:Uncharacterized protein n=1 Tax=Anoxybacillus flavithermus (strain DSM 21510 / WK1) TaxID=491915 RepID=B7GLQ9_ANOFW|nr:Predicted protein [Anoxybacillus flavithermus WK1]